jgi:hypothetical protein
MNKIPNSSSVTAQERESVIKVRQRQIIPLVKIANKYKSGKMSKERALELYVKKFGYNPKQVLEYNMNQFRVEDLLATNK